MEESEAANDYTQGLADAIQDSNPETKETRSEVVNYWNPINFDEILQHFPKNEVLNKGALRSFLFQPERLSVNSHDAQNPTTSGFGFFSISQETNPDESFSSFKILFEKPLLRVKSLQLLSAVIPNAVPSIPNDELYFTYYRLRNIYNTYQTSPNGGQGWSSSGNYAYGDVTIYFTTDTYFFISTQNNNVNNTPGSSSAWSLVGLAFSLGIPPWSTATTYTTGTSVFYTVPSTNKTFVFRSSQNNNQGHAPTNVVGDPWWSTISQQTAHNAPNYLDLNSSNIKYISLIPSDIPIELVYNGNLIGAAPQFESVINTTYPDYPAFTSALSTACLLNASIIGDITFIYNQSLNKIQLKPSTPSGWSNGVWTNGYYYIPLGWNDPNLLTFYKSGIPQYYCKPYYSLNLRSGFTWNGNIAYCANPYANTPQTSTFYQSITEYVVPIPAYDLTATFPLVGNRKFITANFFADLVYTQTIRLYCDLTQGSTQDSAGNAGLLSIIPMASAALGVTFYQNNFNNPLTKIPEQIQDITIIMKTDSDDNFYLPSSASVSLELAIEYN
tara:strand:- start:2707 stop:4374 length:1668 start_codon:yes stop_codon:yes gene_type:complete